MSARRLFLAFWTGVCIGCAASAPSGPLFQPSCSAQDRRDDVCDAKIESQLLRRHADTATRSGRKLTFRTSTSRTVTLEDTEDQEGLLTPDGEETVRYMLHGVTADHFLIRATFWEDTGYQLIDRETGEVVELLARPVFSKSGSFFAVVVEEDIYECVARVAEIWDYRVRPVRKVFEQRITGDACVEAEADGEAGFALWETEFSEAAMAPVKRRLFGRVLHGPTWRLVRERSKY
ncbi:MAG TPA: hypothetical protein VEL28_16360 [Candidatus Binatia bacterium]|nr:hypothetical protein [Candidatus Binatia bacterium]